MSRARRDGGRAASHASMSLRFQPQAGQPEKGR
jgi:hypothetical protein